MSPTELIQKHAVGLITYHTENNDSERRLREFAIALLELIDDECTVNGITFEQCIAKALTDLKR